MQDSRAASCKCKQEITKDKICIGYVLKSADVGTLFSGRNSENSSNTHETPVHIHASVHGHPDFLGAHPY